MRELSQRLALKSPKRPFDSIPEEILVHILSFVNKNLHGIGALVCRRFRNAFVHLRGSRKKWTCHIDKVFLSNQMVSRLALKVFDLFACDLHLFDPDVIVQTSDLGVILTFFGKTEVDHDGLFKYCTLDVVKAVIQKYPLDAHMRINCREAFSNPNLSKDYLNYIVPLLQFRKKTHYQERNILNDIIFIRNPTFETYGILHAESSGVSVYENVKSMQILCARAIVNENYDILDTLVAQQPSLFETASYNDIMNDIGPLSIRMQEYLVHHKKFFTSNILYFLIQNFSKDMLSHFEDIEFIPTFFEYDISKSPHVLDICKFLSRKGIRIKSSSIQNIIFKCCTDKTLFTWVTPWILASAIARDDIATFADIFREDPFREYHYSFLINIISKFSCLHKRLSVAWEIISRSIPEDDLQTGLSCCDEKWKAPFLEHILAYNVLTKHDWKAMYRSFGRVNRDFLRRLFVVHKFPSQLLARDICANLEVFKLVQYMYDPGNTMFDSDIELRHRKETLTDHHRNTYQQQMNMDADACLQALVDRNFEVCDYLWEHKMWPLGFKEACRRHASYRTGEFCTEAIHWLLDRRIVSSQFARAEFIRKQKIQKNGLSGI